MTRILYPALQEPVLTTEQQPETVTESRWHRPLSEPVRTQVVAASIALITASGAVISPWALTQPETVTQDRWHRPLSEPVRLPPRLATGAHQFLALVEAPPFAETVSADRWLTGFSLPIRGAALPAARDAAFFVSAPAAAVETITSDKWHRPWSEPVRVPLRLATASQQFAAFVEVAPFAEAISEDRWHQALSEPVRLPPRLFAGDQPTAFLVEAAPFAEATTVDRWFVELSSPQRGRPGLLPAAQSAAAVQPNPIVAGPSSWLGALSEPRARRAFSNGLQSSAAAFVPSIAAPASVDSWFVRFSEPKRTAHYEAGYVHNAFLSFGDEVATVDQWYGVLSTPVWRARFDPAFQLSVAFLQAIGPPIATIEPYLTLRNSVKRNRAAMNEVRRNRLSRNSVKRRRIARLL